MDKRSKKHVLLVGRQASSLSIRSRFEFTREEIQAFREEHEQRNGELTKPDDDDASNANARPSSLKRPIDLRWSVNLSDPLPSDSRPDHSSQQPVVHQTSVEILRQAKTASNDPFQYR